MMIRQEKIQDVCVVAPQGRLDAASAPQLRKELTPDGGGNRRVVDFSGVVFMDSSGLGALVAGARRLRQENGDLKIACLPDRVRQVFELTRADRLFDIYDDTDAAVRSYHSEASP